MRMELIEAIKHHQKVLMDMYGGGSYGDGGSYDGADTGGSYDGTYTRVRYTGDGDPYAGYTGGSYTAGYTGSSEGADAYGSCGGGCHDKGLYRGSDHGGGYHRGSYEICSSLIWRIMHQNGLLLFCYGILTQQQMINILVSESATSVLDVKIIYNVSGHVRVPFQCGYKT